MNALYTTKPPVAGGISSMEIQKIVHFLSDSFQVRQPKIKITNTRRGKYSVLHETIIMGSKSWRGVHTVVHEFAHHLDMIRRGHAGTFMRAPRTVINGWTTRFGRREFHGESFTLALEDCVKAVFGDQNLYAWESEYRSVKKNHAKRFFHRVGTFDAPLPLPKSVGSNWLIFRPTIIRRELPMAASSAAPTVAPTGALASLKATRSALSKRASELRKAGTLTRAEDLALSREWAALSRRIKAMEAHRF